MPQIRRRTSALATLALMAVGLPLAQVGAAGPAVATPAGAPWYQQWSLSRAWTISKGAGVTVAVVDSGVKASIGDLRGQVLPGVDLTDHPAGAHTDLPIPGEINFGHGTDMAALIAGTGQGAGMVGVAPKAKILPVRVGTDQGASTTAAIKGIRWAVDHGAKVINLSFGGGPVHCENTFYSSAIAYAYHHDVIVVASAGNESGPIAAPGDCPGVITIGGADTAFRPTKGTATGPALDFVAPGSVFVPELLNNTLGRPQAGNESTSQATALASGVFALLRSKFPAESARQIVTRALYSAHGQNGRTPTRISNALGYGALQPAAALTRGVPAQAKNPIFDRFDTELRGVADQPVTPRIISTPAHKDSSKGPLVWIVLGGLVAVAAVVIVLRVRRARSTPPGFGA